MLLHRIVAIVVAGLLTGNSVIEAADGQVNGAVREIYENYIELSGTDSADRSTVLPEYPNLVWKEGPKLLVEVISSSAGAEQVLAPVFDSVGFQKTGCSTYSCSGYLTIDQFPTLESDDAVNFIRPSLSALNQAGDFVSEAIKAMGVDLVRMADRNITGVGKRIGVMSDSFDTSSSKVSPTATKYDDDVASGDLPAGVVVLNDLFPSEVPGSKPSDEGRAMCQLIHDIAPGAELYFHTAIGGPDSFAAGIKALAEAGCDVIVDDLSK